MILYLLAFVVMHLHGILVLAILYGLKEAFNISARSLYRKHSSM